MSRLPPGLYQSIVTEALARELASLEEGRALTQALHPAEAADRLTLHLARVIERSLEAVIQRREGGARSDRGSSPPVLAAVDLARELVALLLARGQAHDLARDMPHPDAHWLSAVLEPGPDGRPLAPQAPITPLLDTTLLTNAPGEPRIGAQLITEIPSADAIDVVMAFIRKSGISPLLKSLRAHCESGRSVRVLTTTYTQSTELVALQALQDLGAQVRVSYDETGTRLHAKAWLFTRKSGYSTAYIGSSNLTHSAQVTGLEWNARFSGVRNPAVLSKVAAVFESYWSSGDFERFDAQVFRERTTITPSDRSLPLLPLEIRLEPFQERLLEQIAMAREQGRHANLLVAATGTGKTVMAAMDYLRLREQLPRARLLFVAHRKEILTQARNIFRIAMRDHAFGELWVDGARPDTSRPDGFREVFASIQSLSAQSSLSIPPEHFDVVIIDEFHHAEAATYQRLLAHVRPRELLGLTATPERADEGDVLRWFGGVISAELRLWDAIDQRRLVPFAYYGTSDGTDLSRVPFRRGMGYDPEGLTRLYTANDVWARLVIRQVHERVADPLRMRALGFCVSVDHARFMARKFEEAGLAAQAIWADTPGTEREAALRKLRDRELQIVFSVDLFNEGVDVPAVDTLLMLRPTDSATLFLQQLGRGLRQHPDKSQCTVLDFVGQHHRDFRFDRKLGALLRGVGESRKAVQDAVEQGFPLLPAGCHLELDRQAQDVVLQSLREAVPNRWSARVQELRALAQANAEPLTLAQYLQQTGTTLEDLYSGQKSWSDLCADAGLGVKAAGPVEAALRRACGRLLHVDDEPRISTWIEALQTLTRSPASVRTDARVAMMIAAIFTRDSLPSGATRADALALLAQHPQVIDELLQLFAVLKTRISHLGHALGPLPQVPLRVHARYTRAEILAATGVSDRAVPSAWQTGVLWAEAIRSDLLAFTLDKTDGRFSPTTRYRDYAISRELIHWESQSVTRADSDTGRRYQRHAQPEAGGQPSQVLLFARMRASDRAFLFLGPAQYVSHSGEQPMAITWRLDHALPGDVYADFAAAVA
ncbi:MAG: family helicase [Pseudomonadota bacterium]|jgi:superfamily II DNA or RNA helicase/HKD family nuclease